MCTSVGGGERPATGGSKPLIDGPPVLLLFLQVCGYFAIFSVRNVAGYLSENAQASFL